MEFASIIISVVICVIGLAVFFAPLVILARLGQIIKLIEERKLDEIRNRQKMNERIDRIVVAAETIARAVAQQ